MTTTRRALLLSTSLSVLAGCPTTIAQPAQVQTPVTVIEWAMGGQQLSPGSTAHHRLVLLSPAADTAPGKAGPEQCVAATAFLPGPPGDAQIYFLVGGEVQAWRAPMVQPARLEGNDDKLRVTRLLAFAKNAQPEEMLITAVPAGATGEQLYQLTLTATGIQRRAPVTLEVSGQEAFFAKYSAPRCLDGGRRCVSASHDSLSAFIDEQAKRGSKPETIKKLGETKVADVAWAGPDGKALLALVACP